MIGYVQVLRYFNATFIWGELFPYLGRHRQVVKSLVFHARVAGPNPAAATIDMREWFLSHVLCLNPYGNTKNSRQLIHLKYHTLLGSEQDLLW